MYEGRNVHFTTDHKPLCSFSGKLCNLRRLNGYAFCVRHILEDPSAPFKQCLFVVKTSGLKCTSAIPGAEEREYCNAHMQVMGIIPKKERKKRTEPLFLPESPGIPNLDSLKLPNDHTMDDKRSHPFSASKMFPELAGKLSLDNQKQPEATQSDTQNKPISKTSPKTLTVNALSSKRPKRPTRKSLSILKKKRLGLLTDEEAKACLTPTGCKTYSHYVKIRTDESQLLTPLLDSSDEDEAFTSSLITHKLREHCSSLSSSTSTDLNTELSDSDVCDSENLTKLKRTCLQLSHANVLNKELVQYRKSFTDHFIETVKDNLKCAVLLTDKIRSPNRVSPQISSPAAESGVLTHRSVVNGRKYCLYTYAGEERRCSKWSIPLTNFCAQHITQNAEQKLFSLCTFSGDVIADTEVCESPAIDIGHLPARCRSHTPYTVDPFALEQELNLRRKKKKAKPFASRRSKKRKKPAVKPQKPMVSESGNGLYTITHSDPGASVKTDPAIYNNGCAESANAMDVKTEIKPEEEEEELDSDTENILSPLDKSLLPLDHDDSKILNDNEIDEVLNAEDFNLFSESDKNDGCLELTAAEADLIFSAADGDEILDNLKGELPDDITDAILHVEYQAELEKQQQEQQQKHHLQQHQQQQHEPLPMQLHSVQQQQQQAHHMLHSPSSSVYEMNGGLNGYTDNAFHSLQQSYSHHGPPPDYPGATKLLPTSHVNHNELNYIHEQNSRFTHHQIHPKISTTSNSQQMLLRQPSYHLSPASPLSLPSSSTHLNSGHMHMNRIVRLPPVSTITNTMQGWHVTEPYQNGFHSPTEHHIYQQHNGLPSPPPPHYATREQRIMYSTQLYNNGAYSINHQLRPAHPQHVNMSLQQ